MMFYGETMQWNCFQSAFLIPTNYKTGNWLCFGKAHLEVCFGHENEYKYEYEYKQNLLKQSIPKTQYAY